MTTAFPIGEVKWDGDGLVPIVAQEELTGEVLMLAWANQAALERSLQGGWMTYWSRSRKELWEKGATSGNRQRLVRLHLDCDGDAVLALVRMEGPACHTGTETCFARDGEPVPRPVLADLAATIDARKKVAPTDSYTAKLLRDRNLASKKIGEEATELVMAIGSESEARVSEEAADVFYHALVGAAGRGVRLRDIAATLAERRK